MRLKSGAIDSAAPDEHDHVLFTKRFHYSNIHIEVLLTLMTRPG